MTLPVNGSLVTHQGQTYAVWVFSADDCEAVAGCMPSGDGWVDDLLKAADQIRARDEPDPDAPGLYIVVSER